MKNETSAAFNAEINKREQSPTIRLYELNYTGDDWLYFTDCEDDVSFPTGSATEHTYTSFPIRIEDLSESREGNVNTIKLSIADASRVLGAYVEQYNAFRGKTIIIRTVYRTILDDETAQLTDKFTIDACTINASVCDFSCSPVFDVMDVMLPSRRFLRDSCAWGYKDTSCAYAGEEPAGKTTCGKTLEECKLRGNQARFGGFPGVPGYNAFFRIK